MRWAILTAFSVITASSAIPPSREPTIIRRPFLAVRNAPSRTSVTRSWTMSRTWSISSSSAVKLRRNTSKLAEPAAGSVRASSTAVWLADTKSGSSAAICS